MEPTTVIPYVLSTVEKYKSCKEEKKSHTECAKEYIRETFTSEIESHALTKLIGGKYSAYVMMLPEIKEYVENCHKDHLLPSCIVGAVVSKGTMVAVDGMSTALIAGCMATAAPKTAIATGITGLMTSQQIGSDFGKVAVGFVDYLIDHVSPEELETVDVTKEVIVRNKEGAGICFTPNEVKMVTQLVKINHQVKKAVDQVATDYNNLENRVVATCNGLTSSIVQFDKETKIVDVKLTGIEINRMLDRVNYDYVNKVREAQTHNSYNSDSHASVSYKDGRWGISFTYNVGGYSGRGGGGGGFSCVIL